MVAISVLKLVVHIILTQGRMREGAPGALASALLAMLMEGGGSVSPLPAPPHVCPGHGFGGQPARRQREGCLCLWVSLAYDSQAKGTQLVSKAI